MSNVVARGNAREASISCVVIRADGRIDDYGVVSYWHRNPLKRLAWKLKNWIRGR
jgi:hypothetical protein